jgi:hypothetical protein
LVEAGDALENSVSGQQLNVWNTARDTGGELLEVESVYTKLTPSRPPAHYHPRQEERFEVLHGKLNVLEGGQERTLEAGEVLTVAPPVSRTSCGPRRRGRASTGRRDRRSRRRRSSRPSGDWRRTAR